MELRFLEKNGQKVLQTSQFGEVWKDVPLVKENPMSRLMSEAYTRASNNSSNRGDRYKFVMNPFDFDKLRDEMSPDSFRYTQGHNLLTYCGVEVLQHIAIPQGEVRILKEV
jgi:hypothetical protein